MSSSTIRKALGAVKDQTSISIAKVSSAVAPELDVAIVKATSHDDEPPEEKYVREILRLTSFSRAYIAACVVSLSRRLSKTRDYVVAVKSLSLLHRLLSHADPAIATAFRRDFAAASRRLNEVSSFRDEAHSSSWDHSAFVRSYSLFLDQLADADPYTLRPPEAPSLATEQLLGRLHHLQQLLDRLLGCRPSGAAKHARMVLVALYPIVQESFRLYDEICDVLAILLDRFFDMEYQDCVKVFEAYASAAKQIDELVGFYDWCKNVGVARSSEFPEVQRISDKLLETLEEFMRERGRRGMSTPSSTTTTQRERPPEPATAPESVEDMNSVKALPASEKQPAPAKVEAVEVEKPVPPSQGPQADLVDLREDSVTADEQGNKLALALFSEPPARNGANGDWEAFPSDKDSEATSAWQTPAAEQGKADWELALVETASNLSKQKAALGGGFDLLLLNGIYDQGAVRQQVSAQAASGSASSIALPGKSTTPVLALPAPDGTVQTIGGDPFAASLSVPPPSYVQMAEIEKKQQLLVQEQQLWRQYQQNGMQGQVSLDKLNSNFMPNPMIPYGMPMSYNTNGGSYYPTY